MNVDVQAATALVTAVAGLVTAVGGAIKNARARRRDRRERRDELATVARAAAEGPHKVADVVDELERTGTFNRPSEQQHGGKGAIP